MHIYDVLASVKTTKNYRSHQLSLGRVIRRKREALGISQEKFAELIDCHRNYVGLVERGELNVTLEMAARFAVGLKCRVTDLVREAGF
jgi:transcriptional regulator with XRE-family HTH domain